MDVVQKISEAPATPEGMPTERIEIVSVEIRDTPPPEPEPFSTETRRGAARLSRGARDVGRPDHHRVLPGQGAGARPRVPAAGGRRRARRHVVPPRGEGLRRCRPAFSSTRGPLTEKQQKLVRTLQPEFNDTKHVKGIVSMAHGDDPASATTSFFIVHRRRQLARREVHRVRPGRRRAWRRRGDRAGAGERRGAGVADRAEAGADREVGPSGMLTASRRQLTTRPLPHRSHAAQKRAKSKPPQRALARDARLMSRTTCHSKRAIPGVTAHVRIRSRQPLGTVASSSPRRSTTGRSGAVRGATACRPKPGCSSSGRRAGRRWRGRSSGAGEGYSSFAVAGGRLFTLGARQGTEYVLAFDAATGKRLWEVANGRRFNNDRGRRAAQHADGRRRSGLRVRVERRPDRARRGHRQGVLDAEPAAASTAAPTSSGA